MRISKAVSTEKPVRGELIKLGDAAKRLNVSPKTAYVMINEGDIPAHRIRTCLRVDSADVDDYIFFSKFNHRQLKLTTIDKQQIINRFEEQLAHSRSYVEKFINESRRRS